MGNLIVYYSKNKDILKIVNKFIDLYNATTYEIETLEKVSFMQKLKGENVSIKRCNLNLLSYQNIILISPLWFENSCKSTGG